MPGRLTGGVNQRVVTVVQVFREAKRVVKMLMAWRTPVSTSFKPAWKVESKTAIGFVGHEK